MKQDERDMEREPRGGMNANEPEPIEQFRGDGWYNVWGVLLAVFIGLVCACIYWIVRLGFWGAVDNGHFGYQAFLAVFLGVCLLGRWSVPYLLMAAPTIDPRTADLMQMQRSRWFFRRALRKKLKPGEDR